MARKSSPSALPLHAGWRLPSRLPNLLARRHHTSESECMRAGSRISHTYDYDRDHILIFFSIAHSASASPSDLTSGRHPPASGCFRARRAADCEACLISRQPDSLVAPPASLQQHRNQNLACAGPDAGLHIAATIGASLRCRQQSGRPPFTSASPHAGVISV